MTSQYIKNSKALQEAVSAEFTKLFAGTQRVVYMDLTIDRAAETVEYRVAVDDLNDRSILVVEHLRLKLETDGSITKDLYWREANPGETLIEAYDSLFLGKS